MFGKKTMMASVLVSSMALSNVAFAHDDGVALALSKMMENVVEQTAQEMELDLQKSIIELGHSVQLTNDDVLLPPTSVSITDIAIAEVRIDEENNLFEQSND